MGCPVEMFTESLDVPIELQEAMATCGLKMLCAALSPSLKQRRITTSLHLDWLTSPVL